MRHITKACILNLLLSFIAAAQTPLNTQPVAQRDPQAVAVLTATLNAADPSGASLSQDFTASGTITYYWAGNEVRGAVTLLGKGAEQFRLDAALPDGTRSFAVSYGIGKRKQPDGTTTSVAFQNTANAGPLNLPFAAMATALTDSSAAITYVGLEDLGKQQVHRIRIQRNSQHPAVPNLWGYLAKHRRGSEHSGRRDFGGCGRQCACHSRTCSVSSWTCSRSNFANARVYAWVDAVCY